jgi:hypothetical protein
MDEDAQIAFQLPDYAILLLILSVRKWQQPNGPIKLYADDGAIAFLERSSLLALWDEIDSEVCALPELNRINPELFWLAPRLFACLKEEAPCVSLNVDLVVWRNLDEFFQGYDLRLAHWKSLHGHPYYPAPPGLRHAPGYSFKDCWSFDQTMAMCITYFARLGSREL